MKLREFAVTALGLSLFLFSASAGAFCRTNTCDPSKGDVCSHDSDGCVVGGKKLYWSSSCVSFAVQRDGSPRNEIDADAFEQVIANAFDTWQSADCGGGRHPSIRGQSYGKVVCDQVEYNLKAGNANIYMFRDEAWMAKDAANALALTTVWHDHNTGEIRDVDVEVNGTSGDITNTVIEAGADLPSIITHETGHFLGLDHAPFVRGAVMYPEYEPGTGDLRTLNPDDEAGICDAFPPDREASTDSCEPRRGFVTICDPPDQKRGGCSLASTAESAEAVGGYWFALAAAVGFGLRRARANAGDRTKPGARQRSR